MLLEVTGHVDGALPCPWPVNQRIRSRQHTKTKVKRSALQSHVCRAVHARYPLKIRSLRATMTLIQHLRSHHVKQFLAPPLKAEAAHCIAPPHQHGWHHAALLFCRPQPLPVALTAAAAATSLTNYSCYVHFNITFVRLYQYRTARIHCLCASEVVGKKTAPVPVDCTQRQQERRHVARAVSSTDPATAVRELERPGTSAESGCARTKDHQHTDALF